MSVVVVLSRLSCVDLRAKHRERNVEGVVNVSCSGSSKLIEYTRVQELCQFTAGRGLYQLPASSCR